MCTAERRAEGVKKRGASSHPMNDSLSALPVTTHNTQHAARSIQHTLTPIATTWSVTNNIALVHVIFVQAIHLTDAALSRSINASAVRTSTNATSALV